MMLYELTLPLMDVTAIQDKACKNMENKTKKGRKRQNQYPCVSTIQASQEC
jgi:hypothetical protein